ncbi:hypothetical protein DHEL01_v201679 [Diaporthe helianthi]|uniref:Uncharacterized protein n=1 Tax=Diaporthe helianthi TaxID=158607 RepID=A0A2P5IBW1_DIAHE|nr:hypothetical protein DHEL01_v201679 [Diaporthe helianthi]
MSEAMSSEQIQMHDFEDIELERAATPAISKQREVDENNEPTLVIGQDVFRNRQRLLEQRRMIAILLSAIALLLLASTITLAVLYGKLLRHGHDTVQPATATPSVTVHHTTTISTGREVATNSLPVVQVTTVTASTTNMAISPATPQPTQCWPGSVWGGADLKEVNEDYGTLMAVALSTSQVGRMGIATDYELVSLRSIFLCGMSMAPGELQVLDVCKAAYISSGDGTRCDEGGSELREGKVA